MTADPFGLRALDPAVLAATPGVKWQLHPGRLAAWVADMDFPVAPAVRDRLTARIARNGLGYPHWGDAPSPASRAWAARTGAQSGWTPDTDRLHDLCDVLQGVRMTLELMTDPGDGVALHTPAYHPFLNTLRDMDRRLVEVPLDPAGLAAVVAAERPRVLLLCHPQNPLGVVFDRPALERIAAVAAEHDLLVISDEIHADLVYAPATHVPFAALGPEVEARTVTLSSASKAFNLAGLRWAVMHAGPAELDARVRRFPDHFFGTPNVMGVEAAVAAFTEGDDWLAAVMAVLDENRHTLADLLRTHLPEVRYTPPAATYLAWLDCRSLGDGAVPHELFRARGVELSPGPQFGSAGAGHVRLNFATSPAMLERIVRAMAGSV